MDGKEDRMNHYIMNSINGIEKDQTDEDYSYNPEKPSQERTLGSNFNFNLSTDQDNSWAVSGNFPINHSFQQHDQYLTTTNNGSNISDITEYKNMMLINNDDYSSAIFSGDASVRFNPDANSIFNTDPSTLLFNQDPPTSLFNQDPPTSLFNQDPTTIFNSNRINLNSTDLNNQYPLLFNDFETQLDQGKQQVTIDPDNLNTIYNATLDPDNLNTIYSMNSQTNTAVQRNLYTGTYHNINNKNNSTNTNSTATANNSFPMPVMDECELGEFLASKNEIFSILNNHPYLDVPYQKHLMKKSPILNKCKNFENERMILFEFFDIRKNSRFYFVPEVMAIVIRKIINQTNFK